MPEVLERHDDGRLVFHCPGCECSHGVVTNRVERPSWEWNGSMSEPTFTPSILVTVGRGPSRPPRICHSFVEGGQIRFPSDCTHALAGQTVPLAPAGDLR